MTATKTSAPRRKRVTMYQAVLGHHIGERALHRAEAAQRLAMLVAEERYIETELAEAQAVYKAAERAAYARLETISEAAYAVIDIYDDLCEELRSIHEPDDYAAEHDKVCAFMDRVAAQGLVPSDWVTAGHPDIERDTPELASSWLGIPVEVARWAERAHRPCEACGQYLPAPVAHPPLEVSADAGVERRDSCHARSAGEIATTDERSRA